MNTFALAVFCVAVATASASVYSLGHVAPLAHVAHVAPLNPAAHIPSGSVSVGHDGVVIAGPSGSVHTDNGLHGHGAGARVAGPAGDVATHGGHARLAGPGHDGHVAAIAHVSPVVHAAPLVHAAPYVHAAPLATHAAVVGPSAHATIVGPTAHASIVAPVAHHAVVAPAVASWGHHGAVLSHGLVAHGHHGLVAHGHHGW